MFDALGRIKRFLIAKLDLQPVYELRHGGYLYDVGWIRSFLENASVDRDGNPIPWITYPALDFIEKRISREFCVFEYGCGNSTLWWASRVRKVISCEHDREWHDKIKARIPANVELIHRNLEPGGEYAKAIAGYTGAFDIAVIDGRDRVNCTRNALQALKPDGVIIWDNSDRAEYREGYEFLFANGFRKLGFVGIGPIANIRTETGVFYRPQNVMGI